MAVNARCIDVNVRFIGSLGLWVHDMVYRNKDMSHDMSHDMTLDSSSLHSQSSQNDMTHKSIKINKPMGYDPNDGGSAGNRQNPKPKFVFGTAAHCAGDNCAYCRATHNCLIECPNAPFSSKQYNHCRTRNAMSCKPCIVHYAMQTFLVMARVSIYENSIIEIFRRAIQPAPEKLASLNLKWQAWPRIEMELSIQSVGLIGRMRCQMVLVTR